MANQSIYSAFERMWEHTSIADGEIRGLINELTERFNALANSDDDTLDTLKEIVDFIKSNKTLIESVTTTKVNVDDIVNDLITDDPEKPLSAAQGVVIKGLIDALQTAVNGKANTADLTGHINDKDNPHEVTATQVGLGNVNNTSDADKPVSTAQATAIADAKQAGTNAQATADAASTTANNALTKADAALPKAGGSMTGTIDVSGTSNILDFGTSGWFRGITSSGGRYDIFGYSDPTVLQVGGSYPALSLRGKNTRPTYNDAEMALLSDAAPEIFVAEYGVTTTSEVQAAIDAGCSVWCNYTDNNGFTFKLPLLTENYIGMNIYAFSNIVNGYNVVAMLYHESWNLGNANWGSISCYYPKVESNVLQDKLIAKNNTDYTIKQVRNIILVAEGEEIPAGTNGDICLVYAP